METDTEHTREDPARREDAAEPDGPRGSGTAAGAAGEPAGGAHERTQERHVNPAAHASLEEYDPTPVVRHEHAEASFTRLIEHQTAKVPSHWFLFAAMAAMGTSLGLEVAGRHRLSRFVGMWPSTLLIAGVYNKLVKSLGPR